jgi:hypothetical protein
MDNHKATPKQWEEVGAFVSATRDCILELRARVEALEAQAGNLKGSLTSSTPPPVATDDELWNIWANRPNRPLSAPAALRTIYNLGIEHGQARSREVAEPAPVARGLVERVKSAIDSVSLDEKARAAILEVARWMQRQGWKAAGEWLEVEAGR